MPVWAGRGQPKGPRAGMTQGAVPSPPPLPFPDQQGGGCSQKDEGGWSRQKSSRQRPDDPTAAVKGWERVSYPAGLRGILGSGSIPVWGPRDTPTKAKPAPAPISLARPKGQKVKAERKELGKQPEPTQAELEQFAAKYVNKLVMETAQQLQAEVRPGGSAPSPRWLGGSPGGVPATSPGWMGPWSLHGTWACGRHPARLRADSSSPASRWTSRGRRCRAGDTSTQGATSAARTPGCCWGSSSSAARSSRSRWSPWPRRRAARWTIIQSGGDR